MRRAGTLGGVPSDGSAEALVAATTEPCRHPSWDSSRRNLVGYGTLERAWGVMPRCSRKPGIVAVERIAESREVAERLFSNEAISWIDDALREVASLVIRRGPSTSFGPPWLGIVMGEDTSNRRSVWMVFEPHRRDRAIVLALSGAPESSIGILGPETSFGLIGLGERP